LALGVGDNSGGGGVGPVGGGVGAGSNRSTSIGALGRRPNVGSGAGIAGFYSQRKLICQIFPDKLND